MVKEIMEIGTIRHFNSGRKYDWRGQLIFWKMVKIENIEDQGEWTTIFFYDVSRGIDGEMRIIAFDKTNPQLEIMKVYDMRHGYKWANDYKAMNWFRFEVEKLLKEMDNE